MNPNHEAKQKQSGLSRFWFFFYEKFRKIEVKVRGKSGRYLCCNREGRLKTKFGPLCLFSFINNLLDYRDLSAKMRKLLGPLCF